LFNNGRATHRKIRWSKDGFGYAQPQGFFWPYKRRPPAGLSALIRQALVCAQSAGFDLINPKHLLNGYKLKAVSKSFAGMLNFTIVRLNP